MKNLFTNVTVRVISSLAVLVILAGYKFILKLPWIYLLLLLWIVAVFIIIFLIRSKTKLKSEYEQKIEALKQQNDNTISNILKEPTELKFSQNTPLSREDVNILVIDDDTYVLDHIQQTIEGAKIFRAQSISSYLFAFQFDIIIADIVGAGPRTYNGFDSSAPVIEDIKRHYPYKYIIAMSSSSSKLNTTVADDRLAKTKDHKFDKNQLRTKIDNAIAALNDYPRRSGKNAMSS